MHASTESLLSYRDERPMDAAVRAHIEHCGQCQSRVARMRAVGRALAELPAPPVPRLDTAELHSRLRRARRLTLLGRGSSAVAACLLAAVVGIQLLQPTTPQPASTATQLAAPAVGPSVQLAALQAESQRLESTLRQMPDHNRIQSARVASTLAALEDQVALIDHSLTFGGESIGPRQQQRLWQGRVALMRSLVELREAETTAIAM
jgi:hypothetical protein